MLGTNFSVRISQTRPVGEIASVEMARCAKSSKSHNNRHFLNNQSPFTQRNTQLNFSHRQPSSSPIFFHRQSSTEQADTSSGSARTARAMLGARIACTLVWRRSMEKKQAGDGRQLQPGTCWSPSGASRCSSSGVCHCSIRFIICVIGSPLVQKWKVVKANRLVGFDPRRRFHRFLRKRQQSMNGFHRLRTSESSILMNATWLQGARAT